MSVTVPTATKVLLLKDCKVSPLTADSEGSPTYGAPVDVPGIQSLGITPEMESKELEGDGDIIDIYSRVRKINWTWNNGKIPLDALKVLLGGTVEASGVTPTQKQTYELGDENAPWFKLEGQAVYVEDGMGDTHVVLPKCKCTGGAAFTLGNEFAVLQASGTAIRPVSNRKIIRIVFNETATDIA